MKLIETDKVEQAIKDYWKAYVDRMPTPYSTEEFEKFANRTAMCFEHRDELLKEIKALPSAEPERKTGRWIHQTKFGRIECDQCGKVFRNTFAPKKFCPNCGAKMEGGEADE